MILDTTFKLDVVLAAPTTTNALEIICDYRDINREGVYSAPATTTVTIAVSTDVLVLAAPGDNNPRREIMRLSAHNPDVSTATVIFKKDNGTVERKAARQALLQNETLIYEIGSGWQVMTSNILSQLTSSLGADVALNNTANYFDGPSVAQGSTGTWLVFGSVTVQDTAGAANLDIKLWDGTTVVASARGHVDGTGTWEVIALSGFLASPAGNLRISVRDITSTSGKIIFNGSGNSKDSTISAIRIA
jgi:hypothetical protein